MQIVASFGGRVPEVRSDSDRAARTDRSFGLLASGPEHTVPVPLCGACANDPDEGRVSTIDCQAINNE